MHIASPQEKEEIDDKPSSLFCFEHMERLSKEYTGNQHSIVPWLFSSNRNYGKKRKKLLKERDDMTHIPGRIRTYHCFEGGYHTHSEYIHENRPIVRDGAEYQIPFCDVPVDDCTCDIKLILRQPELKQFETEFIARRNGPTGPRTEQDMFRDILRQIDDKYSIWRACPTDRPAIRYAHDKESEYVEACLRGISTESFRHIPPQVSYTEAPTSETPIVPDYIRSFYKHFDVVQCSKRLGIPYKAARDYMMKAWMPSYLGGSYVGGRTLSPDSTLLTRVLSSTSWYNRVFGYTEHGSYAQFSHEGLHNKIINQYQKYARKGGDLEDDTVLKYVPIAIRHLIKRLGTHKCVGKYTPIVTDSLIDSLSMRGRSSAGVRAGPPDTNGTVEVTVDESTKVRFSVNGKKSMQEEYFKEQLKQRYKAWKLHGILPSLSDPFWKYTFKHEVNLTDGTKEMVSKFLTKIRTFCIDGPERQLFSRLMDRFRHQLEMGKLIRIGYTDGGGGAQEMAEYLRMTDPEYETATYDISGLDYSIHGVFLEIYCLCALIYFNESGARGFYDGVTDECSGTLSLKLCHLYARVWAIIRGEMPSGAFETSHGDSWIMGLWVFMYLEHLRDLNPHLSDVIDKMIGSNVDHSDAKLRLVIYGDDTVLSYPKKYRKYFGYEAYTKWLETQLKVMSRDGITHEESLSVPDYLSGEYAREGAIFLQRTFVRKSDLHPAVRDYPGLPDIVSYKAASKGIQKFAFGAGYHRSPLCYLVAAIGLAYDSRGTNVVYYRFCQQAFTYFWKSLRLDSIDDLIDKVDECLQDPKQEWAFRSVMGKYRLSSDSLRKGFPSLETLLERHVAMEGVNSPADPDDAYWRCFGQYSRPY